VPERVAELRTDISDPNAAKDVTDSPAPRIVSHAADKLPIKAVLPKTLSPNPPSTVADPHRDTAPPVALLPSIDIELPKRAKLAIDKELPSSIASMTLTFLRDPSARSPTTDSDDPSLAKDPADNELDVFTSADTEMFDPNLASLRTDRL
jgi:hypothetical protein